MAIISDTIIIGLLPPEAYQWMMENDAITLSVWIILIGSVILYQWWVRKRV